MLSASKLVASIVSSITRQRAGCITAASGCRGSAQMCCFFRCGLKRCWTRPRLSACPCVLCVSTRSLWRIAQWALETGQGCSCQIFTVFRSKSHFFFLCYDLQGELFQQQILQWLPRIPSLTRRKPNIFQYDRHTRTEMIQTRRREEKSDTSQSVTVPSMHTWTRPSWQTWKRISHPTYLFHPHSFRLEIIIRWLKSNFY